MRVMSAILMMGMLLCTADALPRLGGGGAVRPAEQVQNHELAVGATLSVNLPGNPTTGYVWQVAECSPQVEVELGFASNEQTDGAPVCGRPVATTVKVTGKSAGKAVVKLIYSRPWEKGKAPHSTCVLNITVK